MALLTVKSSKKIDATLRLEESTSKMIDRYAAFLQVPLMKLSIKGWNTSLPKTKTFSNTYRLSLIERSRHRFGSRRPRALLPHLKKQ